MTFRLSVPLHEGVQPRGTFLGLLYRHNIIAMPTVLARRSAYDLVGPAFSKSLIFDDYEMWMRVAGRYDVGFLDATDASYRIHSAQTTHAEQARLGEHRLELLDEIDRWLPQDFPTVERRRARSGAYFRASYDAFGRRERRNCGCSSPSRFPRASCCLAGSQDAGDWPLRSLRFQARQRRLWKAASTIDRSRLMRPAAPHPNTSTLRAGIWSRSESESEILATLDEHGTLDGLPFMPEMLRFCGERVLCRVGRTRPATPIRASGFRRLERAVHLDELRCDGSSHGGCQASCLLFWKEEWLRTVDTASAQVDHPHAGR